MSTTDCDVLVVGAGPTGLTLAIQVFGSETLGSETIGATPRVPGADLSESGGIEEAASRPRRSTS
ncbi:hypothetical protein [Nocardioides immobilis]|uniref:hypothetical protein n=1 Tax=Nocardioides immobilis TaxID=2049295 RepID=UPI0011C35EC4|nr:hypothetical protein [Nocardioides immobilis]